ncbi:MAG: pentapeptide repeat-containing protein [Pseudomonadota bacterium]
MTETLNSISSVFLFGKIVSDLQIVPEKKTNGKKEEPALEIARVYGYSFNGSYYEMASPCLFQVSGKSEPAKKVEVPGPNLDDDDPFYESLQVWEVNKSDKTIRLDVDAGTFESVLLSDPVDGGPGVSGARVSGARVSGARVSGARVSGARISGARLSGARGDASD